MNSGVTILASSGRKYYKGQDPAWFSYKKLKIKFNIAKKQQKNIVMISTALTIITLERYLKLPRTQFYGVFK